MVKKLTQILIEIILITTAISISSIIIKKGIEKNERVECLKWEKQSKEYPLFYSAPWQKKQCLNYNIKLK